MDFRDLDGNRIDLVAISENGLDDMYEYSKKPEFYRYLELEPHQNIEETKKYLRKLAKRSKPGRGHYWFIKLKAENKVIGTFGVVNLDKKRSSAEIGYGLSPDYWGQGYFSEALMMVLRHLFTDLGFHRIWAKTQSDNVASIQAIEKAGFKEEGVMRDFYLSGNGKWHDADLFSILRDEFVNHIG